ncbi:hypothetical protein A1O3_01902 [Capronia epimyces CBS 606.96]|uniref:Xylose isomerase-like TIM barrel domain-containing protein n=1 Tax=Capronia epimyces CBS 606.96 TaxID=1182542 RepID=W9Y8L1_9EURO|nr:uncharacterized protein A1O3_01902 [Capronia epimyces CBS 606.96]EXJ88838.1 hypothetical protein A1O3_01902 [Capronia epimyces CBS 606.96]
MTSDIKVAVSSASLGQHAAHTLDRKIELAAKHGFGGIEVVYPELERYAHTHGLSLAAAATRLGELSAASGVQVLALDPFRNFEGHPTTSLAERLAVAADWIELLRRLGGRYLQVPSQTLRDSHGDRAVLVAELRQLAELAAAAGVAVAYEPVAWARHVSTWEQAWDLVQAVDRPNFGLCLDNFHLITGLWADNTVPGGRRPGGDARLRASLDRLAATDTADKLFYVQLSDGELFDPPYHPGHPFFDPALDPRASWSRHARPFPLEVESGAYFPSAEFLRSILLDKHYTGWLSLEVFDRRTREEHAGLEPAAIRAERSWKRLLEAVKPDAGSLTPEV